MFKLPKCKYCGEKTKLERMDVIAKNSFAIVQNVISIKILAFSKNGY